MPQLPDTSGHVMNPQELSIEQLLAEIGKLPHDWHTVGSVGQEMLRAVVKHVDGHPLLHSMETGSGKTTLLFSHLSQDHKVFAIEYYGGEATNSVAGVKASPLFNSDTVEYIEGPTQLTLPRYTFEHRLQLALIDGPHGYPFPDLEYYYIYPHLDEGALLLVDDIHIATIRHLFDFLKEDDMFELLEVVEKTAFFRRTSAPTFDPFLDGWWLQNYNKARFPLDHVGGSPTALAARDIVRRVKARIPAPAKRTIKRLLHRQ
jgi:hypothetical protein